VPAQNTEVETLKKDVEAKSKEIIDLKVSIPNHHGKGFNGEDSLPGSLNAKMARNDANIQLQRINISVPSQTTAISKTAPSAKPKRPATLPSKNLHAISSHPSTISSMHSGASQLASSPLRPRPPRPTLRNIRRKRFIQTWSICTRAWR
jgi:hypothetical protein